MALAVKFSEDEFNFRISKITLKTASTATLLSSLTAELKKVMFLFYWAPWQRLSLRDNLRDNPPLCGQKVSDSRTTWQGCRGRGVGHLGPGPHCVTEHWGALGQAQKLALRPSASKCPTYWPFPGFTSVFKTLSSWSGQTKSAYKWWAVNAVKIVTTGVTVSSKTLSKITALKRMQLLLNTKQICWKKEKFPNTWRHSLVKARYKPVVGFFIISLFTVF